MSSRSAIQLESETDTAYDWAALRTVTTRYSASSLTFIRTGYMRLDFPLCRSLSSRRPITPMYARRREPARGNDVATHPEGVRRLQIVPLSITQRMKVGAQFRFVDMSHHSWKMRLLAVRRVSRRDYHDYPPVEQQRSRVPSRLG